jgi:hypothetical protein
MSVNDYARAAIERRLAAIERGLRDIEGIACARSGDAIHVRGRRLAQRSIEDARLRFAGLSR